MQDVTNANFGQLIAYLVPGGTVLLGLSQVDPAIRKLFAFDSSGAPTIGGFLYLTVAAIAAGMITSAIRWAVVDTFHGWTGLRMPTLDFRQLGSNVAAMNLLIEIHYRHYLFYANMLVATAIAYLSYCYANWTILELGLRDAGIAFLFLVFAAASRDTLSKYYRRSEQLLAPGKPQSDTYPDETAPRPFGIQQRQANSSNLLRVGTSLSELSPDSPQTLQTKDRSALASSLTV